MILAAVVFWYLTIIANGERQFVMVGPPGQHQYTIDHQKAKRFTTQQAAEAEKQPDESVGALVKNHGN